jgi:hypothetical protein
VLVINACYSGGFIETLRDDSSMVITSARTDRTSFGCGTQSEITYFGRAFLSEALNPDDLDSRRVRRRQRQHHAMGKGCRYRNALRTPVGELRQYRSQARVLVTRLACAPADSFRTGG